MQSLLLGGGGGGGACNVSLIKHAFTVSYRVDGGGGGGGIR